MKNWIAIGFVLLTIQTALHAEGECVETAKTVESHSLDWNRDGKPDSITLKTTVKEECEGIDQPVRLEIKLSGQPVFEDSWGGIFDHGFKVKAKNKLKSSRLLLIPIQKKGKELFLFVTGDCGSSAPCWSRVYGIREGKIIPLLNRFTLDISEIVDINGDGTLDLSGYKDITQPCGNGYMNYVPLLVFPFDAKNSAFFLDEKLSQKENEKRGYPWAGIKSRPYEEVLVFTDPKTGARRLVWRKEADTLGLDEFCY